MPSPPPEVEGRLARAFKAALLAAFARFKLRLQRVGLGRVVASATPSTVLAAKADTVWAPEAQTLERTVTALMVRGVVLGGGVALDPYSDPVVRWARQESARLVREITDQQRQALQQVLTRTLAGEMNYRQLTHEIRETVGLTLRQEARVAAYRAELLAREIALPEARIVTLVDRYRERTRRQRAQLIAQTESLTAFNRGEFLKVQQSDTLGNDPLLTKRWIIARDEKTCKVCLALDGQTRALNEPFASSRGWIGMHPPSHPSCRCVLAYVRVRGIRVA